MHENYPIQHLHDETYVLPISTHLEMVGTQFNQKTLNPTHPCHQIFSNPSRHRLKSPPSSPAKFYNDIYNIIPPPPPNRRWLTHIHTHLTNTYLQNRPNNNLLNTPSPKLSPREETLSRRGQMDLARSTSGHHPRLMQYKYRFKLDNVTSPTCTRCHNSQDTIEHLFPVSYTHFRSHE